VKLMKSYLFVFIPVLVNYIFVFLFKLFAECSHHAWSLEFAAKWALVLLGQPFFDAVRVVEVSGIAG